MYGCTLSRTIQRLELKPNFGALAGFWILLCTPIAGLLIGVLVWNNQNTTSDLHTPAWVPFVFAGMIVVILGCLLLAVGHSVIRLSIDRSEGLRIAGRTIALSQINCVTVDTRPELDDDTLHLQVQLKDGERVELRRAMWVPEANPARVRSVAREIAHFLQLPLIDTTRTATLGWN